MRPKHNPFGHFKYTAVSTTIQDEEIDVRTVAFKNIFAS